MGYFLLNSYKKFGKFLIIFSLISLYFLSTTIVSRELARLIETIKPLPPILQSKSDRQAIVVLGGGRYVTMPEYGKPLPHAIVLERLRYAMHIQRQTNLPVLISGGRVFPDSDSEASIMNQVLIDDYQFKARWLEGKSRNTAENARNSFAILDKENITKIYLVTHAWHMNRAADIFRSAGFDVIPAPTIYFSAGTNMPSSLQWLPKSNALNLSRNILHEIIGFWWYRFRYDQ